MDPTTSLPSNPCYLPIFEPDSISMHPGHEGVGNLVFTGVWRNFIYSLPRVTLISGWNNIAQERIQEWNGKIINDVVVFDTEQDKMWFILRWS